jgi:hypothetical protein
MMSLYTYFADLLNCTARDMACLRSKSIDEIVSAQMKSEGFVSSVKLLDFFEQWLPWVDGNQSVLLKKFNKKDLVFLRKNN